MRPTAIVARGCLAAAAFIAGGVGAQPPLPEEPPPARVMLAQAADPHRDVRLIKTAYLYNFLKFVRWPPEHAGEITVCIARDTELARTAQDALRGKQVGDRGVRVVAPGEDSGGRCDLRYSARGAPAPARPAELTVGEGRAFVDQGGMIGFAVVDDRVRFFINLKALRESGLSADARLLTVAVEVVQ